MAAVVASTQDDSSISHFQRPVQGVDTEFVVCSGYDDRIVAMVMQTGRLGTVLLTSLSGGGSGGPFRGMAMAMAANGGAAGFGGGGSGSGMFADSDSDGLSDAEPAHPDLDASLGAAQPFVNPRNDGAHSDDKEEEDEEGEEDKNDDEGFFGRRTAASASASGAPAPVPCNVSVLLGRRDEPLLEACARRVVGALSARGVTKPLLLTIQMRQHTMDALKEVAEILVQRIAAQMGASAA